MSNFTGKRLYQSKLLICSFIQENCSWEILETNSMGHLGIKENWQTGLATLILVSNEQQIEKLPRLLSYARNTNQILFMDQEKLSQCSKAGQLAYLGQKLLGQKF